MDFIGGLNEIKERRGLRNKDIAEFSGVSQSHISDILNRKTSPTLETFLKIMGALGIEMELVSEDKKEYLTDRERILKDYTYDINSWSDLDFGEFKEYLINKRKNMDIKKKYQDNRE